MTVFTVAAIFGSLAEFERDLIRERTNAGLAAARARGRPWERSKQLALAQQFYDAGQTDIATICQTLGISRATLCRHRTKRSSERDPDGQQLRPPCARNADPVDMPGRPNSGATSIHLDDSRSSFEGRVGIDRAGDSQVQGRTCRRASRMVAISARPDPNVAPAEA